MKITNRTDYLKAMTQLEIIKDADEDSIFFTMKKELKQSINDYEDANRQGMMNDVDMISTRAHMYVVDNGFKGREVASEIAKAYSQGFFDGRYKL